MAALVTAEYVAATTGADVSDTERVDFLIDEASTLVSEWLGRTFTPENAPAAVRQAVAILVDGALSTGDVGGGSDEVKSEQIGDYRIEYAGAGRFSSGLDIRRVEYLLEPYRAQARSVRTDVPMDGTADGTDPLAGVLVVNQ